MTKRNRLTTEQKMEILALIARGDTYREISKHFEQEYGFAVSDSSIANVKTSNPNALARIQDQIADNTADSTSEILNRSRRMLNHKLKRAEQDENELDKLHKQYRDGEIDWAEYQRRKEGLKTVSIDSLTKVTKEMHAQIIEATPDSKSPTDPRALEKLTQAIQSGDTVELQRIIFNGNAPATTT